MGEKLRTFKEESSKKFVFTHVGLPSIRAYLKSGTSVDFKGLSDEARARLESVPEERERSFELTKKQSDDVLSALNEHAEKKGQIEMVSTLYKVANIECKKLKDSELCKNLRPRVRRELNVETGEPRWYATVKIYTGNNSDPEDQNNDGFGTEKEAIEDLKKLVQKHLDVSKEIELQSWLTIEKTRTKYEFDDEEHPCSGTIIDYDHWSKIQGESSMAPVFSIDIESDTIEKVEECTSALKKLVTENGGDSKWEELDLEKVLKERNIKHAKG